MSRASQITERLNSFFLESKSDTWEIEVERQAIYSRSQAPSSKVSKKKLQLTDYPNVVELSGKSARVSNPELLNEYLNGKKITDDVFFTGDTNKKPWKFLLVRVLKKLS